MREASSTDADVKGGDMTHGEPADGNLSDGDLKGRGLRAGRRKAGWRKVGWRKVGWRKVGADALRYALAILAARVLTDLAMSPGTARDMCFVLFIPVVDFLLRTAGEVLSRLRTG
ncbi:hypothetical protein [Streptomyces sp. NBC_00199]|uniref:hypothetical protein n=1 Tax=Streptomyces sp. NBC_00199 TaxID=2975678 RepID=UPI0022521CB6|nr:hypothetical protein [Streptomyces sp. NBC_00199]MCX5268477.1 hypothetical protein [Streptomyces sp. NBC_00199]